MATKKVGHFLNWVGFLRILLMEKGIIFRFYENYSRFKIYSLTISIPISSLIDLPI